MDQTLTKAEFAARRGVDPSAVSHWIRDGKLTSSALVGQGRSARVLVAEAERQLGGSLDLGQRLAQQSVRPTAGSTPPEENDGHAARYAKARADSAELEAERSRRRLQAEQGAYMETQAATDAWSKEMAAMLQAIDQWWPDLARSISALGAVDEKRLTVEMKRAWRAFRQQRADLAKSAAEALPALVEEDETA